MRVMHIVWSPRRIEESLAAHEHIARELDIDTAFICGYHEHDGCRVANEIIASNPQVDVFLLSYDDQVPTVEDVFTVLRHQRETGDVVSGWQVLGQNSPWGAASLPSWGERPLATHGECFYRAEDIRNPYALGGLDLIPSLYFASLTAVPRDWLLESPIWSMSSWVSADWAMDIWPNPNGTREPYDKGCCSDWTLAIDLHRNDHRIWIARKAEIRHLAPIHAQPAHRFYIAEDEPGIYWNERPRSFAAA